MSYDLNLFQKNDIKKPFLETELKTKLQHSFKYIFTHTKENQVFGFELGKSSKEGYLEFSFQDEKGCYWTYCSYGVEPQVFNDFKRDVKTVATKLDMLIQDPQISDDLMDPFDFEIEDEKSDNRFEFIKNVTEKVVEQLPYFLPSKTKHFILYFIVSKDSTTRKDVLLTLGNDKLYASKVEPDESIDQVVKREISGLTGSTEYKILEVLDHDFVKDRFGKELPRYGVYIEIPYFDPVDKKLTQHVEWKSF